MTEIKRQRICPICEAGCGLNITTDGRKVIEIKANPRDVFSNGHLCPKGVALQELDSDPDRLRQPLLKRNGRHEPVTWDAALQHISKQLGGIKEQHGANAVAAYVGNPTAHNIGLAMGFGAFAGSLGSSNIFSAGTVDQVPKQLASEYMFGDDMAVPVPDIERCDLLLMLGANPVVSNGSLWMVPKFRDKLRSMQQRGGRLVTVDPRQSETASLADEHHFIRPGTDAWLLAALINELRALGADGERRYPSKNSARLFDALSRIDTHMAAQRTGLAAEQILKLAERLYGAERAAVYGRVGTTLQAFGTLTSHLVEVINVITGNLDAEGGAMFPEQAFYAPRPPKTEYQHARYRSRVSGYAEVLGQMPVAALREEIETPGPGQIRALVCFAGNPVVSNPDSTRLEGALAKLDFLVCVDIYHNETTKLADVILPGTSPFEDSHYDHFLGAMGYRNTARYSAPLFAPQQPDEWQSALTLAYIAANDSVPTATQLADFEDDHVAASAAAYAADEDCALAGRDVQELVSMIEPQQGVERLLDLGVRAGAWGDHFGMRDGLTLGKMAAAPHGIDFGAPRPRLAEVIRFSDGRIDLGHSAILQEVNRLQAQPPAEGLLLVGRRNVQTNNSWLQNLPALNKGRLQNGETLCTLDIHPLDAEVHGLQEDNWVAVGSATGNVQARVRLTERMARGVVSLPHGFSQDETINQGMRRRHPGANANILAASNYIDEMSGTVALNGIPVSLTRIE